MAFRPLRSIHIDVSTVQRLTNKMSFIRLYLAELSLFVCEINKKKRKTDHLRDKLSIYTYAKKNNFYK